MRVSKIGKRQTNIPRPEKKKKKKWRQVAAAKRTRIIVGVKQVPAVGQQKRMGINMAACSDCMG